jgi:quercetin dioxygenase-like cupin family protein
MTTHEAGHTSGTSDRPPRTVNAPVQVLDLVDEVARMRAEREWPSTGHTALTLRKVAGLRQLLIVLKDGGRLPDHHTEGEVAIQVLEGEVAITVGGQEYIVGAGQVLDLAPGLIHGVEGHAESAILVTIAPAAQQP